MQSCVKVPPMGEIIRSNYPIPDNPIIPFIEGDGVGADITPTMMKVVDAAVKKAYKGQKKIHWMEIYAGDKAVRWYGQDQYLPQETLRALRTYRVAIKGPLSTPVGGGIRSLNVALRQALDLYQCIRPIRYFPNVPSVLKNPQLTNMVIFRENTEDIYAGIEWPADSPEAKKVIEFLQSEMNVSVIRFPASCGIGIKTVSKEGTERLVRAAIRYAIDRNRQSVTLVHKGNIMKFTEGSFRDWGYDLAKREFGAESEGGQTVLKHPITGKKIIIKDVIADAFLQQILLRPNEYDVIATLNLNGDYISDALAAQVGGIGIAPGANLSDDCAIFEATHGSAPKHAHQNSANPSSMILSAEMMLRYLGWDKAADLIIKALERAFAEKCVTYDFARLIKKSEALSCGEFGEALRQRM